MRPPFLSSLTAVLAALAVGVSIADPAAAQVPSGQPNESGAELPPYSCGGCNLPAPRLPWNIDSDRDGLSNWSEQNGDKRDRARMPRPPTDPDHPDTDRDGLSDGFEAKHSYALYNRYGNKLVDRTNPTRRDSDGDGLSDGFEARTYRTSPVKRDTDDDGLTDTEERRRQTNPRHKDTDGDGLRDGDEVLKHRTHPARRDTDSDELTDGHEVLSSRTDPVRADTDSDGLSDGDEVLRRHTDPLRADSDGDGLSDGDEINAHTTNPNHKDTDGDCGEDPAELQRGTDPRRHDNGFCPLPAPDAQDAPAAEQTTMDYGRGTIARCTTSHATGVAGQHGAWGHYIAGCTVKLTCPATVRVCAAKAGSRVNAESYTGHRVTASSRLQVFSASDQPYWKRDAYCDAADWCATEDLVNIRGGESASVQCNGVRESATEANRAKVSCTLDLEQLS